MHLHKIIFNRENPLLSKCLAIEKANIRGLYSEVLFAPCTYKVEHHRTDGLTNMLVSIFISTASLKKKEFLKEHVLKLFLIFIQISQIHVMYLISLKCKTETLIS